MADISNEQVAATLVSGILASGPAYLVGQDPYKQVGIAVDSYNECLMQLRKIPKGEPPKVARM